MVWFSRYAKYPTDPVKLPRLIPGRFLQRDNRFRATVIVNGNEAWAHVPNSGRLEELFTPGRSVWLAPAVGSHRKTDYDLKLVDFDSVLVSVDARLPNPLFAEALADGRLSGFPSEIVRPEVTYGSSRLDFKLSGAGSPSGIKSVCWVETKSVTLVREGAALFPDAPTSRGRRHLMSLIQISRSGGETAVVFVIQRPDARYFSPHREADPAFAETLDQAATVGVQIQAFTCQVSLDEVTIGNEVSVSL